MRSVILKQLQPGLWPCPLPDGSPKPAHGEAVDLLLETPPSSQACHDGSVQPWGVKRLLRVLAQTKYVLTKRQAPRPGLPPPPASSCHPGRAPSHKSCAQGIQADFNSPSPRGLGRKIYHVHALSKRNNQNRAKGNRTIHCPAMDYPMPGMLGPPFPTSEQTKADRHQGVPEGRRDSRGVAHLPLPAHVGCAQLLAGNLQSARPSPLPRAPKDPKAGHSPVASEHHGPQAPTQPLGVAPAFYRPALEIHLGPDTPAQISPPTTLSAPSCILLLSWSVLIAAGTTGKTAGREDLIWTCQAGRFSGVGFGAQRGPSSELAASLSTCTPTSVRTPG